MVKQFVLGSVTPLGKLTECMSLGATQFPWLVSPSVTPVHGMFLKDYGILLFNFRGTNVWLILTNPNYSSYHC